MALLHVLRQVKKKINIKIVCAHINHKQRKESDEEEQYVKQYCKKYDKTIVIDCAQFHCIKDINLLKGKIIIIRTCIDTCYNRTISRFKDNNPNYTDEELEKYMDRKKAIFKWYKFSNEFIEKIDKI